jgi:hypothetical protein
MNQQHNETQVKAVEAEAVPIERDLPPHAPHAFTNRAFAAANGWTVDAAEKWLRRRTERGEFTRTRTAIRHPEDGRNYWTFLYKPNPDYISTVERDAERRAQRREVCEIITPAVDAARDAEAAAIQPYLEPDGSDKSFDGYCARHKRAQEAYFQNNPGAREAHVAREAAGTVVYELSNGRRPRERDVVLALNFSWGTVRLGSSEEMRCLESAREELE